MIGCEGLNYLLSIGLIFSVYMYMKQRNELKNPDTIESDLIKKAYFDPLTALPNSESINIILDDQISRCERHEKSFFTAIIKINNPMDEVIVESGLRLFNSIRKEDTVGHISKDIFIIIFNEYLNESNLKIILDRILKDFEKNFSSKANKSFKISIDMNINTYPNKSTTKELTDINPVQKA